MSSNCIIKVWACQGCCQLLLPRVGKKVDWRRSIATHFHVVCLRLPKITVSSCTPGYIATDLTKAYAEKSGKTPAEMGMKTETKKEALRESLNLSGSAAPGLRALQPTCSPPGGWQWH